MLLSATALICGFSATGSMQNSALENTGHEGRMAEMLPIYLAMLVGDNKNSKFESLYFTYRKLMFHVTNGRLNDESFAEDAVHQAFLKILKIMEAKKSIN